MRTKDTERTHNGARETQPNHTPAQPILLRSLFSLSNTNKKLRPTRQHHFPEYLSNWASNRKRKIFWKMSNSPFTLAFSKKYSFPYLSQFYKYGRKWYHHSRRNFLRSILHKPPFEETSPKASQSARAPALRTGVRLVQTRSHCIKLPRQHQIVHR